MIFDEDILLFCQTCIKQENVINLFATYPIITNIITAKWEKYGCFI